MSSYAPVADVEVSDADETMPPRGVAVAVVEPDQLARDILVSAIGGGAAAFAALPEILPRLGVVPAVVVLGPTFSTDEQLLEQVTLLGGRKAAAVLITDGLHPDLIQRAMRIGIQDIVGTPLDHEELIAAVCRLGHRLQAEVLGEAGALDGASRRLAGHAPATVTVVMSSKGGSGKSVIALNVAAHLATTADPLRPVCLLDADLQFGDVAVMAGIEPRHYLSDAVDNLPAIDTELVDDLMTVHEPSGLHILAATADPTMGANVSVEQICAVVDSLRNTASHVLIDTAARFDELTLTLADTADQICFVVATSVPGIKNAKLGLQTLAALNVNPEKIRLVLNRADSKAKLGLKDIERILGRPIDSTIPSDSLVPRSVNTASVVVIDAPKSAVAKGYRALAGILTPSRVT